MKKHSFLASPFVLSAFVATSFVFLPGIIFADAPTGNEPFTTATIEATAGESHITNYKLINLTNKAWQSNLIVDWRADTPCGVFSGSGFSATWDRRAGCGTIDLRKNPVYIAIFIENKNISGKVWDYPQDKRTVPSPNPTEFLIVYAEYPEEAYPHGYSSSLLFADKTAIERYRNAKSAVGSETLSVFRAVGDVEQQVEEQEVAPVSAESRQAPSQERAGGVPWIPITLGVVVLGGAGAFVFKKRFSDKWNFAANTSMNDWSKEKNPDIDFGRDDVPDQYATDDELTRRDRDDAIEASDKVDWINREKDFEKFRKGQEETGRANIKPRLSDTAPANYARPEGDPEDPEVM